MRLFQNPQNQAYLRQLSEEFDLSPSIVREELRQLDKSGLLKSTREGRQLFYRADTTHSLFPELQSMVHKALGMDRILESIVNRLGKLEDAVLIDDYAEGRDTGLIDLVLIGDIDRENLSDLVRKTEKHLYRKIRTLVFTSEERAEYCALLCKRSYFRIWQRELVN